MPIQYEDSIAAISPTETLAAAVARWDNEGGAGPTGPQEGYGRPSAFN